MTQAQGIKRLLRSHKRALPELARRVYREGYEAGLARAHGQGRRGRTIRGDATVEGLENLIRDHFSLDRYAFEVRIAHAKSGRRVPANDLIKKYRFED